ncbi:hypothetical protein Tco_1013442, partial [Tanacetum coccineum]
MQAVADWLPNAEHIQCIGHIYANFKKRWSGLQFKRLFWAATATSMHTVFLQKWKKSASFENGISESFNSMILGARGKPIITMLEGWERISHKGQKESKEQSNQARDGKDKVKSKP